MKRWLESMRKRCFPFNQYWDVPSEQYIVEPSMVSWTNKPLSSFIHFSLNKGSKQETKDKLCFTHHASFYCYLLSSSAHWIHMPACISVTNQGDPNKSTITGRKQCWWKEGLYTDIRKTKREREREGEWQIQSGVGRSSSGVTLFAWDRQGDSALFHTGSECNVPKSHTKLFWTIGVNKWIDHWIEIAKPSNQDGCLIVEHVNFRRDDVHDKKR